MNRAQSRRTLSAIALTKKFHMRYMGWWVIVSIVHVVLLSGAAYLVYDQAQGLRAPRAEAYVLEEMFQRDMTLAVLIVETLLFIAAIFALAIMTVHRIAGPYLALKRTCDAIRDGNIDHRLHFREYDGLEEVQVSFNQMMDVLQERIDHRSKQEAVRELESVSFP